MSLRNERVRKTLMKEIADIIQKELRDSRINGVVSITDVEMSHDNSFAKVYYSVLAGEQDKANTIKAIIEPNIINIFLLDFLLLMSTLLISG